MGHDIDVPDPLPVLIGGFGAAADPDPGIGTEEVDGPMVGLDRLDQGLDVGLDGNIDLEGDAADHLRRRLGAGLVPVRTDNQLGPLGRESLGQGPADAARHPRHDELRRAFAAKPTINPPGYDLACYMRWLAMAANGGGIMADYDVFPINPTVADRERLTIWQTNNPCPSLVSGSGHEYDRMIGLMLGCDASEAHEKGQHTSDMLLVQALRGHYAEFYSTGNTVGHPHIHLNNGTMGPLGLRPRYLHASAVLRLPRLDTVVVGIGRAGANMMPVPDLVICPTDAPFESSRVPVIPWGRDEQCGDDACDRYAKAIAYGYMTGAETIVVADSTTIIFELSKTASVAGFGGTLKTMGDGTGRFHPPWVIKRDAVFGFLERYRHAWGNGFPDWRAWEAARDLGQDLAGFSENAIDNEDKARAAVDAVRTGAWAVNGVMTPGLAEAMAVHRRKYLDNCITEANSEPCKPSSTSMRTAQRSPSKSTRRRKKR